MLDLFPFLLHEDGFKNIVHEEVERLPEIAGQVELFFKFEVIQEVWSTPHLSKRVQQVSIADQEHLSELELW